MNTNNTNAPANTNIDNSNLDVLVPLAFNPLPITYKGAFVSKTWDTEVKKGKSCKDLVVKVALEEKNALDQPIVVERRYNMLPRGRGVAEFSRDMGSYFAKPLTAIQLANQSLVKLDGQPVTVAYKKGRGEAAVFDTFKPVEPAQPTASAATA